MRKLRIYVCGPYTKPNPNHNTHRAVMIGEDLWKRGYAPYVPHLSHFWDTMAPHHYQEWLDYDMVWLEVCDAVYRFSGESSGAELEVLRAQELGIPVYTSIEELEQHMPAAVHA